MDGATIDNAGLWTPCTGAEYLAAYINKTLFAQPSVNGSGEICVDRYGRVVLKKDGCNYFKRGQA